jgi:FixJ family two-component response regulator
MSMADQTAPTVFVVDDDDDLRGALCQLLEAAGMAVEGYADGAAFLASYHEERPGCLVLDVAMGDMSGLEVQQALTERGLEIPTLFLTGHGDIPMAVTAVQAGATNFLEKPVDGAVLLEQVNQALELDREHRARQAGIHAIQQRRASLSPRELEVMALVVAGLSSKDIGRKLGLSHRTVEVHRTHIMHKMGAQNLAELVRLAAAADI